MKTFKVQNVKCENCANTIKNYFKDEFGEVKVDVKNATVSLEIGDDRVEEFKSDMDDIGFGVLEEVK
ncbi:MAG: heavy metal transport/detoxification protein [Campylobacter sp.]|nr:heavy metal transport/detoxification protein [Campylobacter sp.]